MILVRGLLALAAVAGWLVVLVKLVLLMTVGWLIQLLLGVLAVNFWLAVVRSIRRLALAVLAVALLLLVLFRFPVYRIACLYFGGIRRLKCLRVLRICPVDCHGRVRSMFLVFVLRRRLRRFCVVAGIFLVQAHKYLFVAELCCQ